MYVPSLSVVIDFVMCKSLILLLLSYFVNRLLHKSDIWEHLDLCEAEINFSSGTQDSSKPNMTIMMKLVLGKVQIERIIKS